MSAKLKDNDLEFSKDDQNNINNFSKLNMQIKDYQKQVTQKNDFINQLDDALTELEIADEDEPVRVRFGDCFIQVKAEQAIEHCEKHIKKDKQSAGELQDTIAEKEKKLKKLRAVLYAKFGNSINLEDE